MEGELVKVEANPQLSLDVSIRNLEALAQIREAELIPILCEVA